VAAVACLVVSSPAAAQTFEDVGVRAQGLAGAYVAIADDATASWWNPAGLATGAYVSSVLERLERWSPNDPPPQGPADETTTGSFAIAFPALGLSYYRLRISQIAPPGSTASDPADRQDPGETGTRVRAVSASQFGVTVGQSIGRHLVLGSTLKLVVAGAASDAPNDGGLDAADDFDVSHDTRVDFDLGAMANFGHLRLGFAMRNVTEPDFGDDTADPLTLERQARAGIAYLSTPNGFVQGVTIAADADLMTTRTAVGDVRHVAAGTEGWLFNNRLGLRGGVSANTIGDLRPAGSVGVSVAVTTTFHVNASATAGRDESVIGWSAGVSVVY
jgi:hypothetical protein